MKQDSDLNNRLSALPPKVALPFRRLLAAGQLSEDALVSILDAGDIARDSTKLLGFAVGYLHLQTQGIPVHDVIRMAKYQRRRINLEWSPNRWKSEHERLSRAEALDRLAAENVAYDVSTFEALLPAQFDGYLIRTSRRLGMEGLRQRHCVASYDPQLRSGFCAIASIFVDRRRWTVQLFATGDPESPLRIGQIKARHNELPSEEVRKRIHETLGIDTGCRAGVQTSPPVARESAYMDTLRRLLPILRGRGVEQITVEFSGYGDSGSIEDIRYDGPDDFVPANVSVRHMTTDRYFEDGRWVRTSELTQSAVNDAIESLTYEYLDETGVDWYNNDGGYGELQINVQRGTVILDVNVRYTESTNEFWSERDIATGEEC